MFIPAVLAGLIWLTLSFIYRLDRLYGDSAYYLFNIINELKFSIAHYRPSGYLVEFIPLYLVRHGSDMKSIIEWFSFNESLVLVGFAVSAYGILKDIKISIAILLPFFLGDRYNYFNPVSELLLASPVLILWIGILDKFGTKNIVNLIFIPFIVFIVYSHPLFNILFPVTYGLLVLQKRISIKWIMAHCGIFILTALYHFKQMNDYDQQQMNVANTRGIVDTIQYYFSQHEFGSYLLYCIPLIIVISAKIYTYFVSGNRMLAIYCVVFSLGYFGMVMYKFQNMFPDTLEPFERYLFPLSIFAGVIYYLGEDLKKINWSIVLTLIIVVQTLQIINYGKKVQIRNSQLINVIEYAQNSHLCKVVVDYFNFNPNRLGHDWIMTTESMLLSKIVGNNATVQVSVLQSFDKELFKRFERNQYVHFPWFSLNQNELNPDYFHFYEQGLSILNTEPSDTFLLNDSIAKRICVKLPLDRFKHNSGFKLQPIEIENLSLIPIPSKIVGKDGYTLFYEWKSITNKVVTSGENKLLADLRPGLLKQLCLIESPEKKGKYYLVFGLKKGNVRYYFDKLADQIIVF